MWKWLSMPREIGTLYTLKHAPSAKCKLARVSFQLFRSRCKPFFKCFALFHSSAAPARDLRHPRSAPAKDELTGGSMHIHARARPAKEYGTHHYPRQSAAAKSVSLSFYLFPSCAISYPPACKHSAPPVRCVLRCFLFNVYVQLRLELNSFLLRGAHTHTRRKHELCASVWVDFALKCCLL